MVLAAHLRAIERQKAHPWRAAIIACTVRSAQYLDCLVAGSGLSGALNLPWTPGTVHACLARWRDGKRLPALVDRAASNQLTMRTPDGPGRFDINICPGDSWEQSRLNALEPVFN